MDAVALLRGKQVFYPSTDGVALAFNGLAVQLLIFGILRNKVDALTRMVSHIQ